MMYVFPITTPALTLPTAKQKTVLPLARGKITRVDIQFPSGLQGYAHLALNRGLYQIFPSNPEGDFASSQETIWWNENYDLDQGPYQLECYTWNIDNTYPHTITVRLVLEPITPQTSLWEEIKTLLGGTGGN
jgi:hypothetical protein